jgi:hypothetical protein
VPFSSVFIAETNQTKTFSAQDINQISLVGETQFMKNYLKLLVISRHKEGKNLASNFLLDDIMKTL